jgi:hypothetical protein
VAELDEQRYSIDELRAGLARFEQEQRAAGLKEPSIMTNAGRSGGFLTWLEGGGQMPKRDSPWWSLRSRWRSWRGRRQRQRFSWAEWEPAITELDDGQGSYVRFRWARSIEMMNTRHGKDVQLFYLLRSLSILGGVAITALSGIGLSSTSSSAGIRWIIFALGFLVAGSAALEQLGHYGQHRMLSRQAREKLLTAGFRYLLPKAASGDFEGFRASIEEILQDYNDNYNRTLSSQ